MQEVNVPCPIVSMLNGQYCSYSQIERALEIVLFDTLKQAYPGGEKKHQKVASDLFSEIMDEIEAQKERSVFAC